MAIAKANMRNKKAVARKLAIIEAEEELEDDFKD